MGCIIILSEEYNLKSNNVVTLCPVGDIHVGSEQFNEEFFEYWLKTIQKIKNNRRIYLMGDLLETASKKVGNSSYKATMSVDEQKEYILEAFKPLQEDIVCGVIGNHERRIANEFDFDIFKDMCRELNIPCYNQYIDQFSINGKRLDVMVRHGKGSASKRHLCIGKLERNTEDIEADLYLEGHNHRLMNWNKLVRTSTGLKRKYYGYTGAFLNYNGYPDSMYLPVEPPAFMTISINRNWKWKFNDYFCDECCPNICFM